MSGEKKTIRGAAGVALAALLLLVAHSAGGSGSRFRGDREETEEFLAWERTITLDRKQEAVLQEALEALPAPCCSQYSAATCCCPCNMARASWGLAKFLIAEEKKNASEVREAVAEWYRTINPGGFSGKACFNGGCARPFTKDGCGGMKTEDLID